MRRKHLLILAVVLILPVSLGGCDFMNIFVSSMIFFPSRLFWAQPEDFGLQYETVNLTTADGAELYCWYLPAAEDKGTLLYVHGNAGNISHRLYIAKGWIELGYSCFLLDYRGYGKSNGRIRSEQDLYKDTLAAYRWLRDVKGVPPGKIIPYGESIGCAGCIELATQEKVGALILMSPFTQLIDLARHHYGPVPKFLVKSYVFDNESKIKRLNVPVFIMQGTRDEIVPDKMGRELFEDANEPKEAFWVENGHHNDLPETAGEDFWTKPADFLNRYIKKEEG